MLSQKSQKFWKLLCTVLCYDCTWLRTWLLNCFYCSFYCFLSHSHSAPLKLRPNGTIQIYYYYYYYCYYYYWSFDLFLCTVFLLAIRLPFDKKLELSWFVWMCTVPLGCTCWQMDTHASTWTHITHEMVSRKGLQSRDSIVEQEWARSFWGQLTSTRRGPRVQWAMKL